MTEKQYIKKAKNILKEIISICYESESIELHQEIASIERGNKDQLDSVSSISEVIYQIETTIELFSDDIDTEDYIKVEELVLELSEME